MGLPLLKNTCLPSGKEGILSQQTSSLTLQLDSGLLSCLVTLSLSYGPASPACGSVRKPPQPRPMGPLRAQPHLSSSPLKLFPMMSTLARASTDQLLHRRLLYRAVPQWGM